MIGNDDILYEAEIPELQNGYKLELKKADTGDVQLEIFNENGELIQECTVFNAAL